MLQYLQYYNNNKFDKIEKEKNENEDEKKEMKIEDDITKDFKNKIYRKLNVLKNDNENNASKEMIKEQSDLLFFGEKIS